MDTITAIATPSGHGAVGIVRISGSHALPIAQLLLQRTLKPRYAQYCAFLGADGKALDQGIALYFKRPHSFTGEDVVELQGHGGPVILNAVLGRIVSLGARLARPGEFSLRAVLNDKLSLSQAEAIDALIKASSDRAARAAMRSLQGEFARRVDQLRAALIEVRAYVEAEIEFSDEVVDTLTTSAIERALIRCLQGLQEIYKEAHQGRLLQEGMHVVLVGSPNAGKSSLLNALSGYEHAIVTEVPGTTRDVLRVDIQLDGLPVHIIDTAGLRQTTDLIEQEGIKRAMAAMDSADRILLIQDSSLESQTSTSDPLFQQCWAHKQLLLVRNKIDLSGENAGISQEGGREVIRLSAKTGEGLQLLVDALKKSVCYDQAEGAFSARPRHMLILAQAEKELKDGLQQWQQQALELVSIHLTAAHEVLTEITGTFTTEDLLGKIFSEFCIGK
jgi:tRNA modification GTPase